MNGTSPWAAAVEEIFSEPEKHPLFSRNLSMYDVSIHCVSNALWIGVSCPAGGQVLLRAAYTPSGTFKIAKTEIVGEGIRILLKSPAARFEVDLQFQEPGKPMIRYTSTIQCDEPLYIPFWPRDMLITSSQGKHNKTKGKIYASQIGARTGLQYLEIDRPRSGNVLYLQNLTSLNDYCEATGTSACDSVGGRWPELGFTLPPTKEKPIPAQKKMVISDAFLSFSPESPEDETGRAKQFINLLADIYLHLPKPLTQFHDWPGILESGLNDLTTSHACWLHHKGFDYLNAYVCDYATPPELMVQLAVLAPLMDYQRWSGDECPVIAKIKAGMANFYDEKIGSVVRWLPSMAEELDGSEEQLKPNVMDSWYLHHPMLNLCTLALQGDAVAKELFLKSVTFTIKVARRFKYNWPVFYDMSTLEVIKAETAPGKGGEKDVAGLYSLVMLHAWELTGEQKYLNEAEKAAKTLKRKGFELFYQANNTAFSARAMLMLYKHTNDEQYLDLSYLCLAGIMKNVQLWECNYGFAKNYNTFFGIFPLNDAPYTAAYEEQEVFASMHEYLMLAEGIDILPSVKLLLAEMIRYLVQRAVFYYPPNLPEEMLSEEVKMGEVDPKLWIALEDLYDGREKAGQVGQEVYGAGVAFGIVPRHYHEVRDAGFSIFVDYPVSGFGKQKERSVSFKIGGDARMKCRIVLVPAKQKKLPRITINTRKGRRTELFEGTAIANGCVEYLVPGTQSLTISWN